MVGKEAGSGVEGVILKGTYRGFEVVIGGKVDFVAEGAAEAAALDVLRCGEVGCHGVGWNCGPKLSRLKSS